MRRKEKSDSTGLGLYMEQIGRFPILTRQQESELVARMGGDPSDRLRQDLVSAHLRLVVRVAKDYRSRALSLEDLIAEGNVGLLRAARRFNPNRGVRFMTCAIWWIRKSILEALDRNICLVRIPDNRLRVIREARAEANLHSRQLARSTDSNELSRRLRLTSPEVEELLALRKPPVRLDPGEGQGEKGRLLDILADGRAPDPGETLERKEASARIHVAMAHLTPREQEVLEHRYGLKDGEPRTLKETGRKLGVSDERVRQVEHKARKRLRRFLSFEKVPSGPPR